MREIKKAEKAALKREEMRERKETTTTTTETVEPGDQIATADDLAGYGFPVEEEDEESEAR
jgi:hypothetical protein